MMSSDKQNDMFENLIWSKVEYKLRDFVDKFVLPQIVRVEDGYYGPTEDSCLGSEQILTLHAVRSTEKIRAKDHRNRDIHIPMNCSQRVELRPHNLKDVYESVRELSLAFPRFVRVVQGYYNLENEEQCVSPGDKLELKKITRGDVEDVLEFENQERVKVRLPMSVVAGFQPLVDGREYYLKELTNSMKPPLLFQFVDSQMDIRGAANVFSSTLGVLKLQDIYRDETIICTTKESNLRYVVTVPKNLEVTVTVAEGALVGDKDYVRICHSLHDGVSLAKVDNLELENLYASRKQIRGYRQLQIGLPQPPPLPPRGEQESMVATKSSEVAEGSSDIARHTEKLLINGSNNSPSTARKDSQQKPADCHDHVYEHISEHFDSFKSKTEGKEGDQKSAMFGPSLDEIADQQQLICNTSKSTTLDGSEAENQSDYVALGKPKNHAGSNQVHDLSFKSSEGFGSLQGKEPAQPVSDSLTRQAVSASPKPIVTKYRPPVKPKPVAPNIPPRPITDTTLLSADTCTSDEKFSDLSCLTVKEVAEFLQKYHFDEFVQLFYNNDVDGDMLISMDNEMLKSLGMNAFQSKKLLKLIGGWRPKT